MDEGRPRAPSAPPHLADLGAKARALYARGREEAQHGILVARATSLEPPRRRTPLARFGYGLALPAALGRIVLRDRDLRRRYLRVVLVEVAVTVAVGVVFVIVGVTGDGEAADTSAIVAFWSSLYAALCAAEWSVLALSRDYQTALARDLCLAVGIPPEDPPIVPRLRVNIPWLRRKVRGRIRGFFVFGAALPLFAVIARMGGLPGRALSGLLFAAWSVYWAGVFVTAKTAYGWTDEERAPKPAFLRTFDAWSQGLPAAVRWVPATYARILGRVTRPMFAPAQRYEASPWELTGLALARALRHVPGLYAMVRPLYGVAAAHLVLTSEARARAEAGMVNALAAPPAATAIAEAPPDKAA